MIDLRSIISRDGQLSYDLGWLIQNAKVSDEELCGFLLGETCAEIERLVLRFMKSPADRIAAVDQIVFTLLLRRGTYMSNISGKALLNQLILEVCLKRSSQRFSFRGNSSQQLLRSIDTRLAGETHFNHFMDSLTGIQRLVVIFYYGQKLSAEETALLLKLKPGQVQEDLRQSQQKLMEHQRSCEECSTVSSSLASMETALAGVLQSNSLLMVTAHENNADWARSLLVRLRHEKIKQRIHKWAFRAAEFCLGMVVILFFELGFSHSWPFLPWTVQLTAAVSVLTANIEPTTQTVSITSTPLPPVTLINSNSPQIGQRPAAKAAGL